MPWREEVSAYRTVVSELMCQQTQIATVIPYFERWTAKWPDFPELARAEEAEVMALWAGLGYYSRARNLLALARQVAALPRPPRTAAEWREFKGVGPYTAAAIASIAFGEPVAVVDGNVVRVLARLDGVRAKLRDASSAAKLFTGRADELVDPQQPGDFNQAMMELGATVCRKGVPDCGRCPLAGWCDAKAKGDAAALPRFAAKERKEAAVDRQGPAATQSGRGQAARRHGGDPRRGFRRPRAGRRARARAKPHHRRRHLRRETLCARTQGRRSAALGEGCGTRVGRYGGPGRRRAERTAPSLARRVAQSRRSESARQTALRVATRA
jgi:A/G-specific adenine glycosylase